MAYEQLALFADDPPPLDPDTVAALCERDIASMLVALEADAADIHAVGRAAEAMRRYEQFGPPPGKPNRRGNPFVYRTAADIIAAHLGLPEPSDDTRCRPMSDAHRRALALERVVTRVADILRGHPIGHQPQDAAA